MFQYSDEGCQQILTSMHERAVFQHWQYSEGVQRHFDQHRRWQITRSRMEFNARVLFFLILHSFCQESLDICFLPSNQLIFVLTFQNFVTNRRSKLFAKHYKRRTDYFCTFWYDGNYASMCEKSIVTNVPFLCIQLYSETKWL